MRTTALMVAGVVEDVPAGGMVAEVAQAEAGMAVDAAVTGPDAAQPADPLAADTIKLEKE